MIGVIKGDELKTDKARIPNDLNVVVLSEKDISIRYSY